MKIKGGISIKSIQTKILIVTFSSLIFLSLLIGCISIGLFNHSINESTNKTMENICENYKYKVNNVLSSIEQSVGIIVNYSTENILSLEMFNNKSQYDEYISGIEELFTNISLHTNGAVAYYYRINPKLIDSVSGFFYSVSLENSEEKFIKFPNTDLSLYEENDIEHVGWYYIPKENGVPSWLMPYQNLNNDIYMISYVVPIYFDNTFIGVIGMDVDFNVLTNMMTDIEEYETGNAYLLDDDIILYHIDLEYGSNINDIRLYNESLDKEVIETKSKLINDMILVLSVDKNEIVKDKNNLLETIIYVSILLLIFTILIMFFITRNIIKPLKKLTYATEKVQNGDFNISIDSETNDEVGLLSKSFQKTINILNEKMNYINGLAFKDSLTKVMSSSAYSIEIDTINKSLETIDNLCVIVFDVNDLKIINDKYGHEYGNRLLIEASSYITNIFGHHCTYRIGGDEFVVILENYTLDEINNLVDEYNSLMNSCHIDINGISNKVVVAYGYAIYDKTIDHEYSDVFERADTLMYINKKKLKKVSND